MMDEVTLTKPDDIISPGNGESVDKPDDVTETGFETKNTSLSECKKQADEEIHVEAAIKSESVNDCNTSNENESASPKDNEEKIDEINNTVSGNDTDDKPESESVNDSNTSNENESTSPKDNEEKIDEINNTVSENDTDDEPEDISLKVSEKTAKENRKREFESQNKLKELTKQKLKERETRNQIQQQEKSERKSLVPEKLDEEILKFVDNEIEVNTEDIITERKNKKIIFSDNESDEDDINEEDDEEEENEVEEPPVKKTRAKYIKDVYKDENNSAHDFLKNHFFGDRVKREHLKKTVPLKKKKKGTDGNHCKNPWLKNKRTWKS